MVKSLIANEYEDKILSTTELKREARPKSHLRMVKGHHKKRDQRHDRQLEIRAAPLGRTVYYPDEVRSFGSCGKPGCCPDGTPKNDYHDQCANHQAVNGDYIFTNPMMNANWNYDTNKYEGQFIDWCNDYTMDSSTGLPNFEGCGDEAANNYCQSLNYARAEWEVKSKMQVPDTYMMGMNNQGGIGNSPTPAGDYIYQVKCIAK